MAKNKLKGRALTSLASTAGFLIMGLTGIILYIVPQGRIAYWTDWRFIGLTKTQWGDIHTLGMFLFLTAGIFHIYFNWQPLIKYLSGRAEAGLKHGREMLIAALLLVVVVLGGATPFPPLSWLLEMRDAIKDSWVVSREYEPPFGHAELVSLKTLAFKTNVPLQEALAELKKQGLNIPSAEMEVAELAALNNLSPMAMWAKVGHLERQPKAQKPPDGVWSEAKVEERFAGTGIGNKTLADIAKATGRPEAKIEAGLAGAGIRIGPQESIKQAADRLKIMPLDLLKAALVEGYKIK